MWVPNPPTHPLAYRTRECDSAFKTFAAATVPTILEQLQGDITRRLDKSYETFDVENAKSRKREKKAQSTLESTERRTMAAFSVEQSRRVAKFQEHEEAAHSTMRVDNRAAERTECSQLATLVSLQLQLQQERSVREAEDLAILDKLAASFHQLQTSILESLGDSETT